MGIVAAQSAFRKQEERMVATAERRMHKTVSRNRSVWTVFLCDFSNTPCNDMTARVVLVATVYFDSLTQRACRTATSPLLTVPQLRNLGYTPRT